MMRRWVCAAVLVLAACGRSASRASRPAATPASDALTLDEVRAARIAGQIDRYERGLQLGPAGRFINEIGLQLLRRHREPFELAFGLLAQPLGNYQPPGSIDGNP